MVQPSDHFEFPRCLPPGQCTYHLSSGRGGGFCWCWEPVSSAAKPTLTWLSLNPLPGFPMTVQHLTATIHALPSRSRPR